ncbi:MAG: nuclear transport factor 2 family protein [Gemmatimonadota bacterium]
MAPVPILAVLFLTVLFGQACHFEDHTPAGSRRDEAQIRGVITEYYRSFSERDWVGSRRFFLARGMVSYGGGDGDTALAQAEVVPADSVFQWLAGMQESGALPSPQSQVIRTDLRQADGYAAVWVTVRQEVPRNGAPSVPGEDLEHWVMRRTPEGWRVVLLTLPWLTH